MASTGQGEFDLIARITAGLPTTPAVEVGAGDDAAILNWATDAQLLVTCDAQVEGRHFIRAQSTPEQIGQRALAVNLSDIAAMGGEPLFALISLCVPPDLDSNWIERLYAGLRSEADRYDVYIVGGNIASIDSSLVVDITLLGRVSPGRATLRSGAHPGDRLCVTGHLGLAAAGLLTLLTPRARTSARLREAIDEARQAALAPQARIAEGRALALSGTVTAMLDISDGLAADLSHLCERSHVGATIAGNALPINRATRAVARAYGRDAQDLALYGGEDYELLFTVRPDAERTAIAVVQAVGGAATTIGWITTEEHGMRLQTDDMTTVPLAPGGWDHLSGGHSPSSISRERAERATS